MLMVRTCKTNPCVACSSSSFELMMPLRVKTMGMKIHLKRRKETEDET